MTAMNGNGYPSWALNGAVPLGIYELAVSWASYPVCAEDRSATGRGLGRVWESMQFRPTRYGDFLASVQRLPGGQAHGIGRCTQ